MESIQTLKAQAMVEASAPADEPLPAATEDEQPSDTCPAAEPQTIIETEITVETEIDTTDADTIISLRTESSSDTPSQKA